MPTATYTPLATVTLSSNASSVTFSSIPAIRDLVLVAACKSTGTGETFGILRFNSDSGNNYNRVQAFNSGSSPSSAAVSNETGFFGWNVPISTTSGQIIFQVMDASATDKHKTVLTRFDSASANIGVMMSAARWANTSAVSAIALTINSDQFASGSTFSLYGVIA